MSSVHLTGITWDHPRGFNPLVAASQHYAPLHDVNITWEKRSLKDFGDAPIDQLAQAYDLLVIDHPHVGLAAARGCLLPLEIYLSQSELALLARQSVGPSHESYTYKGNQWALAIDAAAQISSYRADLLRYPLPQSWQDVLLLGEKLHVDGVSLAVPLVATDAICSFLTLCASMGHPLREQKQFINKVVVLKVLEFLTRIVQSAHPASLEWNR